MLDHLSCPILEINIVVVVTIVPTVSSREHYILYHLYGFNLSYILACPQALFHAFGTLFILLLKGRGVITIS